MNAAFNEPVSSQFIHSAEQPQLPGIPEIATRGAGGGGTVKHGRVCVLASHPLPPPPSLAVTVVSVITKFNEWIRHGLCCSGRHTNGVCFYKFDQHCRRSADVQRLQQGRAYFAVVEIEQIPY